MTLPDKTAIMNPSTSLSQITYTIKTVVLNVPKLYTDLMTSMLSILPVLAPIKYSPISYWVLAGLY